jgi:hypothetical protein
LAGVEDRWPSRKKVHDWVHNSAKVIQSDDAYAVSLFNEYNKTQMTCISRKLSTKDIDAILDYVKLEAGKATAVTAGPPTKRCSAGRKQRQNNRIRRTYLNSCYRCIYTIIY